jgi:hypothetical protein
VGIISICEMERIFDIFIICIFLFKDTQDHKLLASHKLCHWFLTSRRMVDRLADVHVCGDWNY